MISQSTRMITDCAHDRNRILSSTERESKVVRIFFFISFPLHAQQETTERWPFNVASAEGGTRSAEDVNHYCNPASIKQTSMSPRLPRLWKFFSKWGRERQPEEGGSKSSAKSTSLRNHTLNATNFQGRHIYTCDMLVVWWLSDALQRLSDPYCSENWFWIANIVSFSSLLILVNVQLFPMLTITARFCSYCTFAHKHNGSLARGTVRSGCVIIGPLWTAWITARGVTIFIGLLPWAE